MKEYHKIQTVYLRDPDNDYKTLLEGRWARPEFGLLRDLEWTATEKVDGTNIRVMYDGDAVTFNGKTDRAQLHVELITNLQAMFPLEAMRKQFGDEPTSVCLYGEGYGAGIQSGGYYRPDKSFILFDVNIGGVWLERSNVTDIAQGLGIQEVPVVAKGKLGDLVEYARGGYDSLIAQESHAAEGLIMRPSVELRNRLGDRIITKIKYKDFGIV